jgi:hypothetical protein
MQLFKSRNRDAGCKLGCNPDQIRSVAIELSATGAEVHAIQTGLRTFDGYEMVQ